MKFIIGSRTLPTKKAALEAVRRVLNNTPIGTPLIGEDYVLIRALLDMHRYFARKLANGCRAIVVRFNRVEGMPKPQRGFWIIGDNGVETDFSIYVPFRTDAQNDKNDYDWAARAAVVETARLHKVSHFAGAREAPCEISGMMMSWEDAHVHHDDPWPFDRIHKEWIDQRGGYPDLAEQGELSLWLMTPNHAAEFVAFHNARAILRVVHKKIHLNLKNRPRKHERVATIQR